MSKQKISQKNNSKVNKNCDEKLPLTVSVWSFGYKNSPEIPQANTIFDVRFLQNPYWVDELRPLTGLDKPVQEYVLKQEAAKIFFENLLTLLKELLPVLQENNLSEFSIAFGCTGGQHRSVSLAEKLVTELKNEFPDYQIRAVHRELSELSELNEPN